jgi:hypothetical protein
MNRSKNALSALQENTELKISDESLHSFKTSLGVDSTNYENLNEVTSNNYNMSTSQEIVCITNNLGYCEVIINPVFLISRKMMNVLKSNNEMYVSNIFITNQNDKVFGQFQTVVPIPTGNIIEQDFDVYKFQKIEIYKDFLQIADMKVDSLNNLGCDENTIKIQLIDGKSINIISTIHTVFKNHLLSDKLNNRNSISSSKQYDINDQIAYTFLDQTLGVMDYYKNGYNCQNETPLLIQNFEQFSDIVTPQYIKYERFLTGNDDYNFGTEYQDNIQKLNYALNLTNANVLQNNLYNQASQKNDKLIRILIRTTPYKKIKFLVNSFFTIKLNNQMYEQNSNLPQHKIKTIMSYSDFEKNVKKVLNLLVNVEPSLDPALLIKMVKENYTNDEVGNSLITFLTDLWNKAKEVAKPIVEKVEQSINEVTTVVDFISTIVLQNQAY